MNVIKKSTLVYYAVLYIALLFTWARQDFIPMPIRLAYMALVFAPIAIKRVSLFFPCLVLFLTTSLLSFAGYTFLPTETTIYLLLTLIFVVIAYREHRDYKYPYVLFFVFFLVSIVVNLVTSGKIETISYSFLLLLLLPITINEKEKEFVADIVPKLFILSTTACACLTLLNQELLIQESYNYERLISGSLNYTCCTLGIGFVLALRELIKSSTKKYWRLFYVFCMMVLLITVIMEASRGAMLAIVVSSLLIVFNKTSKLRTKIITVVLASIFIAVLYNNQVLDLLIYRIQSDTGTGTGRTEIWGHKLTQHFNSFSFLSFVFGRGYDNTWNLGGSGYDLIGCHNDFVAFLIEYGIIGIILFLTIIFYPLHVAKSRSIRSDILPLVVYLLMTCMTLEPFSMGYLPFCFFLFFIYLRSYSKTV